MGGDGDGHASAELGLTAFFDQSHYCSGGDGDGYTIAELGLSAFFDQSYYCSGGDGDGHGTSESLTITLNDQILYCSGGDGDGHAMVASLPIVMIEQSPYCSGGDGDGYHSAGVDTIINIQEFYCSGGNGDGFSSSAFSSTLNIQDFYCSGGDGDGYGMFWADTIVNIQDFYCSGGYGDGHAFSISPPSSINDQSIYCSGGDGDGYIMAADSLVINIQNFYCSGGAGDGYSSMFGAVLPLGVGLWTGLVSTAWYTATNWQHDIIPGISNNVTIPAGCPNYPDVGMAMGIDTTLGFVRCHGLDIQNGGSFDHTGALYLNGVMTVSGAYTATIGGFNSHRIFKRGNLSILATGVMIVGNLTVAPAMADMVIYDGGEVSIHGGTLIIDDKLWLRSGGSLTMTDGELIAHKYGIGSAIMAQNPGFFYVEAGALGGISGGNFRICGYDNDGPPHIPPYSMVINEPGFDFTGSSTIHIQHGIDANHHNMSVSVVDGVHFQNLIINKAYRSVFIRGNLFIDGDLTLEENSTLEIEPGYTVTMGP